MTFLTRLYPRDWRERYEGEVVDLVATSRHPCRDRANVALHAVVPWLEVPMIKSLVLVSTAIALVVFGFTIGQLADGVAEIPRHWWSLAAAGVATCGLVATIAARGNERQRSAEA